MSGSERLAGPDLRGPLLAVAAWAGSWLCTAGEQSWAVGCGLVGLAAALVGWRSRRPLVVACGAVLLVCVITGGWRSLSVHTGPIDELAHDHAVATLTGRVSPGKLMVGGFGPSWHGQLLPETVSARAQRWQAGQPVLVTASGDNAEPWAELTPGTTVQVLARLAPSKPSDEFGAIARATGPPMVIAAPDPVSAAVQVVRDGLHRAVAGLAEEPKALVPALVVGDTSAMGTDLQESFRVTGLSHLAAVSGANLVLLLASLLWFARQVGVRGWWLRGVALVSTAGFVLLCHSEPSVLRAAAMGTVGVAALGWGGRAQGLRFLSWAVIGLLLIDPWLATSVGFALSVLATAGIVVFARPWTDALARWMPVGLAEGLAVPVAAQLATQPVVAAISGQVSVVGVLTNLVAGPLVGPTTVIGFLCAALGWWAPGPAAALGWVAGWGAQGLCWTASLGALLPSAAVPWPATPLGLAILAGLSLSGFLVVGGVFGRPAVLVTVVVALVVVVLRPVMLPGWPPDGWAVAQCAVGQGTATVVSVGPGQAVVADTGPDPAELGRCLAGLGVERVPLVVISHFHADHIDGLPALAGRGVATIVLPRGHEGPGRDRVLDFAASQGAQVVEGVPGLALVVGDARVEVLSALADAAHPAGSVEAESSWENDGSVVTRIDTGEVVVLATGDIEHSGQFALLRAGVDLRADVIVVPHHGSADQSAELLAAVSAPIALIGVGLHNDYGHPTPTALRMLTAAGAAVYRTDTQGSIAVARSDTGWTVTTEHPG